MHIGIVAESANVAAKTGIEHYAKQLILHLARIDHANRYTLYLRSAPEAWLTTLPDNFAIRLIPFAKLWTQLRVSWELLRRPVDVLFVPSHHLPLIHPRRTVVTLHDTNFMHHPETDTRLGRWFLYGSFRHVAATARRIIAVSDATKRDIANLFSVASERITVVHHGYEALGLEHSPREIAELPTRYVLFLSTIQPRKNLERLIDAFRAMKERHPELPHKLVVAGKLGWKADAIMHKMREHAEFVTYLGHVPDDVRWTLYRRAELFVVPSLNEGFGMGVLEAFACDVPVALSRVSSLPEVAGDAALYFDPLNVNDMADTLARVLADDSLRRELATRGRQRLAHFSWDRCAQETLSVLTADD